MSAHHSPDRSQQGSSAPSPTVPAIHNHPMSRKVPNGQNGQGIGPARQSASQPNMHPPPPPPPPPQPNGNTPDQTLHRRGSSSTGRTPAGSPHTEQMNMSNPGSRPPSSSSNGRRMSRGSIPIPHAPPPQALLAERHPPPARTVPSHPLQHPPPPSQASSITPQPMNIPSAPMAPPLNIPPQLPSSHPPPMTPTTPTASGIKPAGIPTSHTSEVLNPVQRRSAFAPFTSGGQPTPTGALTATSSQSSNLSNARERSSSAEVPLAQELAKRQRDTSNQNSIDHLNKKPRIEEAPITGESSIQDNLHQVAPGIPDNPIPLHQITPMDQYIVAGPPPEQEQSQTTPQAQPMSLVSPTEMLQDSPQPPPATEIPGQMPESVAEEPDEDGEEVELDADGLYPAEECLKEIMSRDKEQPNQQYCALCVARFASGHLAAEPAPFINATTEELVLHCTTEHQEVWNQLREPE